MAIVYIKMKLLKVLNILEALDLKSQLFQTQRILIWEF